MDNINLTVPVVGARGVEPDVNSQDGGFAGISPDGKSTLIITKAGNVNTGQNEYQIILYKTSELRLFINKPEEKDRPKGRVLITKSTSGSSPAIRGLRWLRSGNRFAFIGSDGHGADQIFEFDLAQSRIDQVTRHAHSILAFEYAPREGRLLFEAEAPPSWTERQARGLVVGPGTLLPDLITRDPDERPGIAYFVQDLSSKVVKEIHFSEDAVPTLSGISIDPSGRWGLVRSVVGKLPGSWAAYRGLRDEFAKGWRREGWDGIVWEKPYRDSEASRARDRKVYREEDAFAGGLIGTVTRYVIIDVLAARATPLMDAPVPPGGGQSVKWEKSGERLYLSGVYAPLGDTRGLAREELASTLSNLVFRTRDRRLISGEVGEASGSSEEDEPKASDELKVSIAYNEFGGPEYQALDPESGFQRIFTKLNPELSKLDVGEHRDFAWKDALGRSWSGELQFPIGYVQGQRYPLVIETNATSGFLLPTQAHAPGQTWAKYGIVVLRLLCEGSQPPNVMNQYANNPEFGPLESHRICVEGAVDKLDAEKIIDPAKVGWIGFSYTGNRLIHSLAFSDRVFQAAVVVDSVQDSLFSYLLTYGTNRPGMGSWDAPGLSLNEPSYIGAVPVGDGWLRWIQRSVTFHVDRIVTPVLFEYHGTDYPPSAWETYAILKRIQRPTELVHYALGAHALQRPSEIQSSQERIIDWMLFWLENKEDSDPTKRSQYERWRILRHQRDLAISRPRASLKSPLQESVSAAAEN